MADLRSILQYDARQFSPVVPFNPLHDKLISLDFTENNQELSTGILNDTTLFSKYIDTQLNGRAALYGIGGYGEHRTIYSRSDLFDSGSTAEQPRRLHLGTDIWGMANTPIMAPLDAVIHSFAFNDRQGDYGATILLSHVVDGFRFLTLYGHLSLASIKGIQEGDEVKKGQSFAGFGLPQENGNWPPHLHFQLIIDPGDYKGDYPGVCKYGEKEEWLNNSPDPDLILQLNRFIN